jgi:S-adenosyl methyltransferase
MTTDEAPPPNGGTSGAGPPGFDISVANQARMYDYLLGGKDNYAAARAAIDAQLTIYPDVAFAARANRAFLGRAVRYLTAEAGIRQFLDIGTGIPTAGNTHQVAQEIAPETRVVYVDYDPIVLAHARALLTSHEAGATDYVDADLRDTGAILAVSHMGRGLLDSTTRHGLEDHSGRAMQQRLTARSREEVARFFAGMDLVPPGVVRVEDWRPEPGADAGQSVLWGAVGRRP